MPFFTDLRIRGQYGSAAAASGGAAAPSDSGSSFSQALSAACQTAGGTNYECYFQLAADTYQVPVDLIKAVAKAESNFNKDAVSHCGAQGIMQLMPATARSLGVTNSFDPAQNIMGGTKYLRQMLDCFGGDVSKAVAAYNAGPNAVKKYGGVPPYQETQKYVTKVLGYAGSGVSVPQAASVPQTAVSVPQTAVSISVSSAENREAVPVSAAPSQENVAAEPDLADLLLQMYRFGGACSQEYVRQLMQQIFLQNIREDEEQDRLVRI